MTSVLFIPAIQSTHAEGSRSLYPVGTTGTRANFEWRTSTYGEEKFLTRRTLLKAYAQAGEVILLGSSAIGVPPSNGGAIRSDILIYTSDEVYGDIGRETFGSPTYSCNAQRTAPGGLPNQGQIRSRAQELAGPDAIPGGVIANGYTPCFFVAPTAGIYSVVMYGPAGGNSNIQGTIGESPTGEINLQSPVNFDGRQETSIAAWDVTVRSALAASTDLSGRVFTYNFTAYTGGNARPVYTSLYVVTTDGFMYQVDLRGLDPNGFAFFGSRFGLLDTDGSPLDYDALGGGTSGAALDTLQGGIDFDQPSYPIFFDLPAPETLQALDIPLIPDVATVTDFHFSGSITSNITLVGQGGIFDFSYSTGTPADLNTAYLLIISRDGVNFDPKLPQNRALRGLRLRGTQSVDWNGTDNSGQPFPAGTYQAKMIVRSGEFHFPLLDVENSIEGGPTVELINPPDTNGDGVADCPALNGGCRGAFYDDRGYLTADGNAVGTPGEVLCGTNPPPIAVSDQVRGYDTATDQRAYGLPSGGNTNQPCTGAFGDEKVLNLWTYYQSVPQLTPIRIIDSPTAIDLVSFTAQSTGEQIRVDWQTSREVETWGFHLYRSTDGSRDNAVRVTDALIAAQGRGKGGATYRWTDSTVSHGQTYTYWLHEIELDGTTNVYGPAAAALTVAPINRMFVPFIVR